MNYIGSKLSLINDIKDIIREFGMPENGIVLDLFSGTGIVSQSFKSMGYTVYSNDWQYYSFCLTASRLVFDDYPLFCRLADSGESGYERPENISGNKKHGGKMRNRGLPFMEVLSYLNNLTGKEGKFYNTYCKGGTSGRMYFSHENGLKIQAVRDKIEEWHTGRLIEDMEKTWLIACLLESADRVANTASVYGAYLKKLKKTALKPMKLAGIKPVKGNDNRNENKVYRMDSFELLNKLAGEKILITYIDPPYNRRQYSSNYHILETIARWDLGDFIPRGITGLRGKNELISDYCLKSKAHESFKKLFSSVNSEYVLLSYNNEGLLDESFLKELFETYCPDYKFVKIPYQRFRADTNHSKRLYKTDETTEFLVIGRTKNAAKPAAAALNFLS